MSINVNNLKKHPDTVVLAAQTGREGDTRSVALRIATGNGDDIATSGYWLPPTYEGTDFTPETARSNDPKSRELVEKHPAALHAARAIADISALSAASLEVGKDSSLSASGRSQKLGSVIANTMAKLGSRVAAIEPIAAALQATEAKLLTPPAPDHSDVLIDSEIRSYLRSLSVDQRNLHLIQLGDVPNLDRMLVAVRRSPIPIAADGAKVDAAWRTMVARTQPAAWKACTDGKEVTTWATGFVEALARLALNPHDQQGRERLNREELYAALKPTGAGLRLGKFQPYEAAVLDQRLAAAAAARAAA